MKLELVSFWLAAALVASAACRVQSRSERPPDAKAHYLANAGVLVARGPTKVVFDPLFRNDFGTYRLLPEAMERALFAGEPPFDGIDAVFVSHYHQDHFSRTDLLRLLKVQPAIELYAPAQAVREMRAAASDEDRGLFERVTEIALAYEDRPLTIEAGDVIIEAVRIPHAGWPESLLDVENIAYRVTLDETTTVVHLGDADTTDVHFARDGEHWDRRHTHMAFPPYWYFQSEDGRGVLERRLKADHAVGVHVPVSISDGSEERPEGLRGVDLFLEPGETRDIPQ